MSYLFNLMFFIGLLHGDEAISVNMCLYIMNKLIYGYVNKDPSYTYILENREIWLIPIINADAYIFIENRFETKKILTFLKKNMKIDNFTNANQCGEYYEVLFFLFFFF